MPVKPAPKPKFNTLTTAGRVAKAAHERAAAMEQTPPQTTPPPPQPSTSPVKKKRKARILPPPHEIAAEAKLKEDAKEAKNGSKKKKKAPLTTKEKLAESSAARARERKRKQPVVHDGVGLKVVEGGSGEKSSRAKKTAAEKPKNLMDFMRDFRQMPAAAAAASAGSKGKKSGEGRLKAVRESVLVRPTERTKRLRVAEEGQRPTPIQDDERQDNTSPSKPLLMTLPREVRQRIWRLVVVEAQFFVYPAISPEQPDLAMTGR